MGLSSKQVSNRGLDWNQTLLQDQNLELPKPPPMRKQHQQTQPSEPLKCPRCDSINTKFCYYNNYNKSQPRHYCRACKRHWTKGGTLRNVPVGGGKKNKRVKKSITPNTATTSISTTTSNANMDDGELSNHIKIPSLAVHDHKTIPSSLYLPQQNNLMSTKDSEGKDFGIGNGIFLSSTLPFPQNQSLLFPFTTSNSFDTNLCTISSSLRSSSGLNYGEEFKIIEEPVINTSGGTNTWEIAATSSGLGMSNYWSWEDIDSLVSTDPNVSWDDSDIKP